MPSVTSRQSSPAIPGAPVTVKPEQGRNRSPSSSISLGTSLATGRASRVSPPDAPVRLQSVFHPSQTSAVAPGFTAAAIASVMVMPVAGSTPPGVSTSVVGSSRQSYPPRIKSPLVLTAPVLIVTCSQSRYWSRSSSHSGEFAPTKGGFVPRHVLSQPSQSSGAPGKMVVNAAGAPPGLTVVAVSLTRSAQSFAPLRARLAWAWIAGVVQPAAPGAPSRQRTKPSVSSSNSSACTVADGMPVPLLQSLFQPSQTSGLNGKTADAASCQFAALPPIKG